MIKVEVKNGSPYIDGRRCSYETKKIRTKILEFAEVNEGFILPKKYTYVITELNGFAKIVKARNQGQKLPIHSVVNSDSDVCPNKKDCKIIMFTADLDICQKCNKTFEGK